MLIDGWQCPPPLSGPGNYLRRARDVDRAMKWAMAGPRACIQAGGHVGTVPVRLTGYFEAVITLEPHAENFRAMVRNCEVHKREAAEVIPVLGWLFSSPGFSGVLKESAKSSGQHQVHYRADEDGSVMGYTIDGLCAGTPIAGIFLDIEGGEYSALLGAAETIKRDRPVIMVEENKRLKEHGRNYGDVARLLARYDYHQVDAVGEDLIFAPRTRSAWEGRPWLWSGEVD